jgi:dienelactone hydrolase
MVRSARLPLLVALVGAALAPAAALAAPVVAPVVAEAPYAPTTAPGPHAVGRADWEFGEVQVKVPGSPEETMPVAHFGTLRYPATSDGVATPVAPGGPFPFVVFAHGRYQVEPYIGTNHTQAGYLLDHLASWGFVVASVNLDVVGQYAAPPAILQRGELIVATIEAFGALDPDGLVLDLSRLGLVGHSRGGEGCLSAWKQLPEGAVSALATIAPTDFGAQQLHGVPYLGLYGSKDGDVNNGWPIHVWDDAGGARKALQYVEGANHFWFTDGIHYAGEGAADITREQHHDIARVYVTTFLMATLRGQSRLMVQLCDGAQMAPITDELVLHPMYSDPGALVVDDFQDEPADPATNSLGGVVAHSLLKFDGEASLDAPALTFYHHTRGGVIGYDSAFLVVPLYVEELPGGADVSAHAALSLRALQRLDAGFNQYGAPQDLRIALMDAGGRVAFRTLGHYGTIPWPETHAGASFPKKSVLRTTRIPLKEFLLSNPALDLSDIRYVGLVFDQTPAAELRIDDLEFTP